MSSTDIAGYKMATIRVSSVFEPERSFIGRVSTDAGGDIILTLDSGKIILHPERPAEFLERWKNQEILVKGDSDAPNSRSGNPIPGSMKITFAASASEWCNAFADAATTTSLIEHLDKINAIPPSWETYKPTNVDGTGVIVTDTQHLNCAVIYSKGAALKKLMFSLPLQGLNKDFDWGPSVELGNSQNVSRLTRIGLKKWVQLNADKYKPDDPYTFIHEAFHQFWQNNSFWSAISERDTLGQECYLKNDSVAEIYRQEWMALHKAFSTAISAETGDSLRDELRQFVTLRNSRYALLRPAVLGPRHYTCEEAEAAAEVVEGSADFVTFDAFLRLGLKSPSQLVADFAETLSDNKNNRPGNGAFAMSPYYKLGMMELFILKKVSPQNFRSVTSRIDRGESSPFKEIARIVE